MKNEVVFRKHAICVLIEVVLQLHERYLREIAQKEMHTITNLCQQACYHYFYA